MILNASSFWKINREDPKPKRRQRSPEKWGTDGGAAKVNKPATIERCRKGSLGMKSVDFFDSLSTLERKALEIALGVLRSDTDYGDFLNSWLQDYGRKILSPNPPAPLLPDMSMEEEIGLLVENAPTYIN
jgi:hypothetical protein